MVGMGGATTLLTATMTTAWLAATRLTVARLAWSGAEVESEGVTEATGVVSSTPSTQHSRWFLAATKIKVGFDFPAQILDVPWCEICSAGNKLQYLLHPVCADQTGRSLQR